MTRMVCGSLAALSLALIMNLSTNADYTYTPIDLPDALETNLTGINNNGDIVGYYRTADSRTHGFLLSADGNLHPFDEPDADNGTFAFGINDAGTIVGEFVARGTYHGFVLSDVYEVIDAPNATQTRLNGINNRGEIVGDYFDFAAPYHHGLLLSGGKSVRIDVPNANAGTVAFGINNTGEIVGAFYERADSYSHGFLRSGEQYQAIDFPGARGGTVALGINYYLQIVGYYYATTDFGILHSFQRMEDGQYVEIALPGATQTFVRGINDLGQIVGSYSEVSGRTHGFVATPN